MLLFMFGLEFRQYNNFITVILVYENKASCPTKI